MQTAQIGDQVTLVFEGKLESGEVFESSTDSGPITFVIGENSVLPAFEAAVIGMQTEETKIIKIKPENGYGPHNQELVQTVSRSRFSSDCNPATGMVVSMPVEVEGRTQKVPATITGVEGDQVTVDFNHPLAGKELLYKITLQAIVRSN